jgi:hypothetical protein|tara:strand:+ start:567 stop:743 length:177 start_codon:yes stop_codon:yes gene_type:complete
VKQEDLLSFWVVMAYDPSVDMFLDAYKSYGQNVANEKLVEYLSRGICAIIEHRKLPMV